MTKSESIVWRILGPTRLDMRSFALAVDRLADLLFVEHIPRNNVRFTRDVYPFVAIERGKKVGAVTRDIERLGKACWREGNPEYLHQIIGKQIHMLESKAPRDMIVYVAHYLYFDRPYYETMPYC